jgi:hypothetical protein
MAEDIHPGVDEIKPYVAVGPTKELSVTVHKETFDAGFIIFTIVFGLALLIVVGVTIFFAYQQSKLPPPPPGLTSNKQQLTLHTNLGAATTPNNFITNNLLIPTDGSALTTKQQCESVSNTKWVDNECKCNPPFFGPTCSQERHDSKYYAVGIPNESTLNINVIDDIMSYGKSFSATGSKGSCSDFCNKSQECIGFIYHHPGMCTLLKDDIIVPKDSGISYSTDVDSTLYLKSSNNLHFEDRIFLGAFISSFPPRYWLIKETPYYAQLLPNVITKISFAPTYTKIYGSFTGIYSLHPFSNDDIDILLNRKETNECYIHRPGTTIDLPPDWKYKTHLYVVYV